MPCGWPPFRAADDSSSVEQRLDALVSPMSTVPPLKLTSPREPALNGRTPVGWSLIGQQGFPVITVPAGPT
jgi:amidase